MSIDPLKVQVCRQPRRLCADLQSDLYTTIKHILRDARPEGLPHEKADAPRTNAGKCA